MNRAPLTCCRVGGVSAPDVAVTICRVSAERVFRKPAKAPMPAAKIAVRSEPSPDSSARS